ncbi:hemerythrin family protein [Sulfurimonas sp. SWIR-19]|uniref:hemerythrin family protein n=1 Tax=Sulfurimonas sp. SWIR-19 TaxID=2878390 RepID=UPI001CF4FED0|nr:hemerythrin family protein [Sulfurimonas sp. SWIR-19]UCN01426.1 hemerythrin family protein [Sulfurimonas sp. SWIR-19]
MLIESKDVQQVSNAMMNILHEEEIEIINNFHDAVLAKDIKKIDELFQVVLFDVEDHFTTEEDMMEESNFYAMQMHKSEHDTMREKIKDLLKEWNTNKDPEAIQTFLEEEFKHWIVLHVARWDSETAMHIGDTM